MNINLQNAINHEVLTNGFRVESQNDQQAVLVKGKETAHVLHLVLTALSCGAWGVIWGTLAYLNRRRAVVLTTTPDGLIARAQS